MANFFDLIKRITFGKSEPEYTSAAPVQQAQGLTPDDIASLKKIGLTIGELGKKISDQVSIAYDRQSRYQAYANAQSHWYMSGSAAEVSDLATVKDDVQNRSIWITSKDTKVYNEGMKFLDSISIEDRIKNWAWNCCVYGDLFISQDIKPGVGIVDIDDSKYPGWIYRVDHHGRLVGFVEVGGPSVQTGEHELLPPWVYTHFKLQGSKSFRYGTNISNPNFGSMGLFSDQTMYDIGANYGASMFSNAMAAYNRVVLVEDSLLLSRISKGIQKYIYKIGISGSNATAAADIIDAYTSVLKRARSQNTSSGNAVFENSLKMLGGVEDIILPVYGDVGQIGVEKIGGEVDIKWIVDIEDARNQLASAVRVPLQLLGGFAGQGSAGIGSSEIEVYDARFARVVKNVQRCIQNGVMRMLQIHFAAIGLPADALEFEVHMATTSATEEDARRDMIDKGVDTATKVIGLYKEVYGEEGLPSSEKEKLLNYLNKKILKMPDLPEVEANDNSFSAFVNKFSESTDLKAPTGRWIQMPLLEGQLEASLEFTDVFWHNNWKGRKITIEKVSSNG